MGAVERLRGRDTGNPNCNDFTPIESCIRELDARLSTLERKNESPTVVKECLTTQPQHAAALNAMRERAERAEKLLGDWMGATTHWGEGDLRLATEHFLSRRKEAANG